MRVGWFEWRDIEMFRGVSTCLLEEGSECLLCVFDEGC
jgi:hypothetical protein